MMPQKGLNGRDFISYEIPNYQSFLVLSSLGFSPVLGFEAFGVFDGLVFGVFADLSLLGSIFLFSEGWFGFRASLLVESGLLDC